jgi:geranylgeranylglycerol-phosphate geranylgeranyltransferase
MGGYFALLRPGNGVVAAAAVVAGALAGEGPSALAAPSSLRVALGCVAAFAFIGAGNALNDYFDRETDKVAHPSRPIPSGRMPPLHALWISGVLFLAALAVSAWLSLGALLVVASSAAVMVGYERGLKSAGLPGNLAIAYLSGITFFFGGVIVGFPGATVPLALLAVLASLGREVAKDIEDMDGDKDRQTLPQRLGVPRAAFVSSAATAAAVALSPLLYLPLGVMSFAYVPFIAAGDATFIYAAHLVRDAPGRSQRWSKAGMALSTLAFAAGGWVR